MKCHLTALLAATALTSLSLPAQTTFDEGDTDIGIGYDLINGWDLHVHQEEPPPGIEVEPADALLQINGSAQTTVPAGAQWSFLGTAGSPVWILPNVNTTGLLYLGWATEEIISGVFVNDEVTLSLKSVNGPGDFSVYSVSFGNPNVRMNSGDGLSGADALVLPTGIHQHFNVAFTAPGAYKVGFEASGTLVSGNTFTSSGDVDYFFAVVPEPSAAALIGVGMASLLIARRGSSGRRQ
jgi:surface-anchored protein